tara:strand:+ start:395 stop:652 length:258 start_codon:yes stop_codon:yes gene_type:complete
MIESYYGEQMKLWDEDTDNVIPLEKDYKYQMKLLKQQLQMILDDDRGNSDMTKRIEVLEIENKILKEKNKFLQETITDIGILTKE